MAYVSNSINYGFTNGALSNGSVISGNVIVGIFYYTAGSVISSMTTNRSASVSLVSGEAQEFYGYNYSAKLFYAVINSTGSLTITPTWSTAPTFWGFSCNEYSDIDTSTVVEGSAIQLQAGRGTNADAYTSGTFNSLTNNATIVGFCVDPGFYTVLSAGTGFTIRHSEHIYSEDRVLASAGSTSATFTSSKENLQTAVGGFALKPVGTASPTALPRRALDGPFYGSLRGSVQ